MAGRAGGAVRTRRPTTSSSNARKRTTGTPAGESVEPPPVGAPPTEGKTGTGGGNPVTATRPYRFPTTTGRTEDGAGFLLALIVWGWVIMPFLQGGPTQVRNVLRAKFFNKGPGGEWLP